ncbi:MAG: hypothetical protein JO036_17250 [Candidatus Eremiobacteraeota bacterium]|nr:hypothetical protein [Candidatus Eremiobacteraeota bacterium]
MSSRVARIATAVGAAIALVGNITYKVVKEDLNELAHAHLPGNATSLGAGVIFLLGCSAYLAVASVWKRRGYAERPPMGIAALLTFAAMFVFINAMQRDFVPGAVYFVLQTLFWDAGAIFVLFLARNEDGPLVLGLRIYAVALVAFQSIVGVLGATYAGDSAMADVAGVIGCVSTLAMLALALRRAWFEPAAPEPSSAPLRRE